MLVIKVVIEVSIFIIDLIAFLSRNTLLRKRFLIIIIFTITIFTKSEPKIIVVTKFDFRWKNLFLNLISLLVDFLLSYFL